MADVLSLGGGTLCVLRAAFSSQRSPARMPSAFAPNLFVTANFERTFATRFGFCRPDSAGRVAWRSVSAAYTGEEFDHDS
jgi:hypothetical protein